MKADAVKIRRLMDGSVLCGFAGRQRRRLRPAGAIRGKLKDYPANVPRAATELAKEWRTDRALRRLEALLTVADRQHTLLVSGTGDVIQPTDGIVGIGSGGNYAVAAARALVAHSDADGRGDRPHGAGDRRGHRHLHQHAHIVVEELECRTDGRGKAEHRFSRRLTPRQIVSELDRYIVGQDDAKRAVAIAIRNRWRRQQLPDEMRREVAPKNILMIGPTGVGKTEIARRLARLTGAPFIKVEATKYTEVGYYGRDVESMVRELVENAIGLVPRAGARDVEAEARQRVDERLLDLLCPAPTRYAFDQSHGEDADAGGSVVRADARQNAGHARRWRAGRSGRSRLTIEQKASPVMFGGMGMEQMDIDLQGMFEKIMPKNVGASRDDASPRPAACCSSRNATPCWTRRRSTRRPSSWPRTWGSSSSTKSTRSSPATARGADVSRQGVQRDLLPIVEGTTVQTRYGYVRTDHVLFVAAGAFHRTKPSDLMPELQGRFPIRVELTRPDQRRFRADPDRTAHALTQQYPALLGTESVELEFTADAVDELAEYAYQVNQAQQNIGARRLYTILETLLDDVSFEAPDRASGRIVIDAAYVRQRLERVAADEDLSRFIL